MKTLLFVLIMWLPVALLSQEGSQKTRLIILADMMNEPDEEQQMMHMLMCSNEFDLEGLIAVARRVRKPPEVPVPQVLYPDAFHRLIDGYEEVHGNLIKHAIDYPEPDYLRGIVASGQKAYGIKAAGPWKSSEGSMLIERALDCPDPRPIYVVVNGGSNTLAQALMDYRSRRTEEELNTALAKLRVYENGAQDDAGAWICHEFPEIHWFRSNFQAYCYAGPSIEAENDGYEGDELILGPHTWKPYAYSALGQHQWALEHIVMQHGPLGTLWPMRSFHSGWVVFMEGGGTTPWLCLVNRGLSDISKPWWGGWSGRSTREKVKNYPSKHAPVRKGEKASEPFFLYGEGADHWVDPEDGRSYEGIFVPVWRWRQAFFNDIICRMDWCIHSYEKANHHPKAVLDGDTSDDILLRDLRAGEKISLSAEGSSDPDGDPLEYRWWYYPEAGTYEGRLQLASKDKANTTLKIPEDAAGKEIHIILEVKDRNEIASLWDYRRMVIRVGS